MAIRLDEVDWDTKIAPLQGVDLVWDTSGERNCWIGNNYKTSFPPALPACFANER